LWDGDVAVDVFCRVALGAWVIGTVACTEEPPFEPRYETERLQIGTSFAQEVCRGNFDAWEATLDAIEELLQRGRERVWLYLYEETEMQAVAADCDHPLYTEGLRGCWDGAVVRSTFVAVEHELVHAWAGPRGPSSLEEGLAMQWTGAVQQIGWGEITVKQVVEEPLHAAAYESAGHFVAWLLDTYGRERFMALYGAARRGATQEALSETFVQGLGSSLDEVMARYRDTAKDFYPSRGGFACGQGEVVPWSGEAAEWRADGTCEDGPLLLVHDVEWWQRVTVEVSASGLYALDTGGRPAALFQCLTAPADLDELAWPPFPVQPEWAFQGARRAPELDLEVDWAAETLELALEPGVYEVWVYRGPDEAHAGHSDEMALRRQ